MSYLLKDTGLISVDKKVHFMIEKLINGKRKYKYHGSISEDYTKILFYLDILQYSVIDPDTVHGSFTQPRVLIEQAKKYFIINKAFLDEEITEKIKYLIDFFEPHVEAWELIHTLGGNYGEDNRG